MAPGPHGGTSKLPKLVRDPGMKAIVPTQNGESKEGQLSWYSQCKERWRRKPEKDKTTAKQSCSLPPLESRAPAVAKKLQSHPFMEVGAANEICGPKIPIGLPRSCAIARQQLPEDQRPSTAEIQETATRLRVSMYEALAFCLPPNEDPDAEEKRKEARFAKAEAKRLAKAKQDLVEYQKTKAQKEEEEQKAKEEEKQKQEEEAAAKEAKRLERQKALKKQLEIQVNAFDEKERAKAQVEEEKRKEEERKEALRKKYLQKQKAKVQQWHLQKDMADTLAPEAGDDAFPDAAGCDGPL
eukprot:gnl/MRDRNA2_/MRDRNA2_89467_c0_seq1.p1 gnl/MRDRNA2_/MRDRNA2_89467_c0~~gnl/MRDRNA2_/MRDRNA2_89467_c0_seq1.p1  ORF type:complete len:297 (+),score=111.81 gnl/MRDRNA2_/MRDRNA2_89467_c0_seq1:89-979(+)